MMKSSDEHIPIQKVDQKKTDLFNQLQLDNPTLKSDLSAEDFGEVIASIENHAFEDHFCLNSLQSKLPYVIHNLIHTMEK